MLGHEPFGPRDVSSRPSRKRARRAKTSSGRWEGFRGLACWYGPLRARPGGRWEDARRNRHCWASPGRLGEWADVVCVKQWGTCEKSWKRTSKKNGGASAKTKERARRSDLAGEGSDVGQQRTEKYTTRAVKSEEQTTKYRKSTMGKGNVFLFDDVEIDEGNVLDSKRFDCNRCVP